MSTDGEVVASERECKVREAITLIAFNRILSVKRLLCANLFVPNICELKFSKKKSGKNTYRSSAMVEGRAIREVPVSRITPVLSISAVSLPKVIASRSTSQ